MVTGDLHAFLAVLVLLPERLGEVRRRELSHILLQLLLGGLLGEVEPANYFFILR
jgi:hypothetical protein